MKKVYLAGPTVFLPNAKEIFADYKKQIIDAGHIPLTPFDSEGTSSLEIMQENIILVRSCDVVFADLQPFRGTEPDSGTVFEVGYATALNKQIFAYNVLDKTYKTQVQERYWPANPINGDSICPQGFLIEDFNQRLNCMLSHNIDIKNSFQDCVLGLNKNY